MNHKTQIIAAFQASAPGVCTDSTETILSWSKPAEWNIKNTPSGGLIGVVLSPKSGGVWRLYGVGIVDATQAEAVAYAIETIGDREVYAYDPGDCQYGKILAQLPVAIRSVPSSL